MGKKILLFHLFLLLLLSSCNSSDDISDAKIEFESSVQKDIKDDNDAIAKGTELESALRHIATTVLPSVVEIRIKKKQLSAKTELYDFFRFFDNDPFGNRQDNPKQDNPKQEQAIGSGFLISTKGFIVTNAHVIDAAVSIEVVLDDTEYKASVVGIDKISDIAVIKLENERVDPLPYLSLSDASFEVGDLAIAVGNPFGLSGTFTFGVISAKGRTSFGIDRNAIFKHFIQTDASINRGNSGGPLLNIEGDVIGINTAIYSGSNEGSVGIGFAIPSTIAKAVVKDLIAKGKVERGYIGISIRDLDKSLSEHFGIKNGVLVLALIKGGAGARGGLNRGDIITKVNGQKIENTVKLINTISSYPPNTKINVTVIRNDKEQNLIISLEQRPSSSLARAYDNEKDKGRELGKGKQKSKVKRQWLGLSLFEGLGKEAGRSYIAIDSIKENSPAYNASTSLRKGDIIKSINYYAVYDFGSLDRAIKKARKKSFLLWIKRADRELYAIISTNGR